MEFCKSQRGADQLLYQGHKYQLNRKGSNGKTFWRCHNRNCPGRVTVQGETVTCTTDHSHPPTLGSNNAEQYIRNYQERCATTTQPVPRLYNEMIEELARSNDRETVLHMPTYPSLKSSMYRARLKKIPALPKQAEDINIEGDWAQTLNNDRFFLREDGEGNNKILVFGTDIMLERLSTCSTLYMDGTFAACPKLFYQLFTINIYIDSQQYPAVYALLPSKSRNTYNRLFTVLKEEMQNRQLDLLPPRVLTDFELALMQSVNLHFPTATISGCYFHFHQCLYRWVQIRGHSQLYNERGAF